MKTEFNQRWRDGRATYRPAGETINPLKYEVAEVGKREAKEFVERHHYSGSFPAARRRFGLFDRGRLVGVAAFSHPCNDLTITNVFGCESASDGLELGRFVLLDGVPANGETWFKARCREVLKKDFVGIISFSDDTPRTDINGAVVFGGHIGTIYQASNAAFLGRGTPRKLRILPDGRVMNERTIQKIRKLEKGAFYAAEILERFGAPVMPIGTSARLAWLNAALVKLTRIIDHPGNLKYAWSFSKKVELNSLPYPKIKGVL